MSKMFLKNLNDFQNKAVSTLLAYKNQLIIVKSQKFTGKTMLASKLFEQAENDVIIYHTGCCPELFKKAKKEFIKVLNKYNEKSITIILDEYYDDEIIDLLTNLNNTTCYLLTNDLSLNHRQYMTFNYYNFYNSFIHNEYGRYLNLHEILNKDKDFSKKNENLRHYSKSTTIFVKENNEIKQYKMEIES